MKLDKLIFIVCSIVFLFGAGFIAGAMAIRSELFPTSQINKVSESVSEVVSPSDNILKADKIRHEDVVATLLPDQLQPGLVLVAGDRKKRETSVRIIDRTGAVLHEWNPIWSEVWGPEEGDFPKRPITGQYLHGLELLPDGSFVANFEHQSTFRMGPCGNIVWKLDNLGHHSVHLADDGTLWVPSEIPIQEGAETGYPGHKAPLRSWTLQNLSLDGEILREIPVIDIFLSNGLEGLLFMSDLSNMSPVAVGDTLHLNDIEAFPSDLDSQVFEAGDLLISLRNINAVLVIDPNTLKIKLLSIGGFTRQHDPDFIDGDRISVFDNRNFTGSDPDIQSASRIVEIHAGSGRVETVLTGDGEEPFFTNIMGVHQRLPNGNFLVVPSQEGRVLEFTPDGQLVWRYDNRVEEDLNLRIYLSAVLEDNFSVNFFQELSAFCDTDS